MFEQARERDLLLIAPRQLSDQLRAIAALHAQLIDPALRHRALAAGTDPAEVTESLVLREENVVRNGLRQHQALLLAVLAEKTNALRPPVTRIRAIGRTADDAH